MSTVQARLSGNLRAWVTFYVAVAGAAYGCRALFGVSDPQAFWGFWLLTLEVGVLALWAWLPRGQDASKALFVAALGADLASDALWVASLAVGGARPEPGTLSDLLRFGFNGFLLLALLLLLGRASVRQRAVAFADGAVIAASLALVLWEAGYEGLWNNATIAPNQRLLALSMAGLSALNLTLASVAGLAALRNGRSSPALVALATGFSLVLAGDLAAGVVPASKAHAGGPLADAAAAAGLLLVGFGARLRQAPGTEEPSKPHWSLQIVQRAPSLLAFAVLLIALGSDFLTSSTVSPSLLGLSLAVIALIGFRQSVAAISEHYSRSRELEEIKDALERDVMKKTAQLREMLDLSHSVNETLDIQQILCRSLDHARKVVRCTHGLARFFDSDGPSEALEQAVWREGQPVQASPNYDVRSTPDFQTTKPNAATFGKEGAFYVISVDLAVNDRLMGWIALGRSDRPFDAADVDLLRGVGQIAAPALANANTYRLAKDASERDPTTNLLNHRAIHERLVLDLEKAKKSRMPLSLIMVDIDNFQRFNSTYGHTCGDDLLKLVAKSLASVAPAGALVGRFGADEFVIGLPGLSADAALAVASQLAFELEFKTVRPSSDAEPIPVAVTCGIATFPEDCDTYEELLLTAEQNLEQARLIGHEVALTSEIHRVGRHLRANSSFEVLDMLVTAVDNKDSYTRKHSEQVAEFATWLCEAINLDLETTRLVQQAALLHDVGKIGVPAEILGKPGRLTDEEVAAVNKHPILGANLVSAFKDMEAILPGVRHHHERWDGLGYPDGLAGTEIPLIARILCIADTFSAMVTDRAYRKALDWEVALEEIRSHIGTQFDPELAAAFLKVAARKLAVMLPRNRRAA